MEKREKVSVICLSYNHEAFISDAVASVFNQNHESIELIAVDDGSTDGSKEVWLELVKEHPEIQFINLNENVGNCTAFNKGFAASTGDFIIDLAADDFLYPSKVSKQLETFRNRPKLGVVHHNVRVEDENGQLLWLHSEKIEETMGKKIPQGLIFNELIAHYIVNSPSMMIRRKVLEELEGYDESLSYEDFDFWLRSAKKWEYFFLDEVLMKVRKLKTGMSGQRKKRFNSDSLSTLKSCRKITKGKKVDLETHAALEKRLNYELKQAILLGNKTTVDAWWTWAEENKLQITKLFLKKLAYLLKFWRMQ